MRYLRWIFIPLLIVIAAWRLAPHLADFSKFIKLTADINYLWIALAIVSQTGQYIGDGWLSQILLAVAGYKISLKNTFKIASLNVFAAHLLPVGEAGALATIFYFYRKLGVEPKSIIFLSISWSLITGLVLFILTLISIFFLPQVLLPFHPSFFGLGLTISITLIILILYVLRKIVFPKVESFLGKFDWARHPLEFIKDWRKYKNLIYAHPADISLSFLAAAIYYLTNVATLAFSFLAFGSLPPLSVLTFAYAISLISGWITLAPAGIGASEASLILIFLHYKIEPSHALAAIVVFRLITFWLPIPAGALSYWSLKKKTVILPQEIK